MFDGHKVQSIIGKGTFGNVYKAIGPENMVCAIKCVSKEDLPAVELFRHEIHILKGLRQLGGHPNVIQYLGSVESDSHVGLVTDFCDGMELFDFIIQSKSTGEHMVKLIIYQVLQGCCI
jgi:serine/threonine protein kinase